MDNEKFQDSTDRLLTFINDQIDEEGLQKEVQVTANELLKKKQKINKFTKQNLFSEGGVFRNLSKEEQKELLSIVLTALEEETQGYIEESDQMRKLFPASSGISWAGANLEPRLNHLLAAAENGIFLSDWKERIVSIEKATHYYYPNFLQQVISSNREKIREVTAKIEKLSSEFHENFTDILEL